MFDLIRRFPFFIQTLLIFSLAMLLPAVIAMEYSMWHSMRIFIINSVLIFIVAFMLGILLMDRSSSRDIRDQLLNLLLVFILLPPILALPIVQITDRLDFWQASFEMLSSLTTTGATLITSSSGLMLPILVYSALVAWLGAFVLLIIIYSIMEPAQIGGFELVSEYESTGHVRYTGGSSENSNHIFAYVQLLAPAYFVATLALVFLLTLSGERFLFAVIHGWSIMSSSGISPYAHLGQTDMHIAGEFVMFIFLFFGISRHYLLDMGRGRLPKISVTDPEMRVVLVILGISFIVFSYFFVLQEFETRHLPSLQSFAASIWGMIFTVISFLTTHGYISEYWQFEVSNIEIHTSSIYLLGLAMLGGGVATTSGGIKLLRIYAISRLASRELSRLIDPESIAPSGVAGRQLRRRGGLNAFVFLMLFIAGVSATALLLAASGMGFEASLISAVAATTNCGPVINLIPDHSVALNEASNFYLFVFGLAMIFGRVEVFVIIALFNPSFWRTRGRKLL